jgi:hypothetical protein
MMASPELMFCFTNDLVRFAHEPLAGSYNACDFQARLEKCNQIIDHLNETTKDYNDQYFQLFDIQKFLSQANNFLSSGFNIGVAVFALITNSATVIVIVKARRYHTAQGPVIKKNDELNSIDQTFFTYMLANAIFNLFCSLVFLLNTCVQCVPTPVSEIYMNMTGCVISDMWVAGVMSLMKFMSNYTYLQMSMNRYLLVGKDHAKWVQIVAQSNFKTKMFVAFISSLVLSLVPVYEVYYFEGFQLVNNGNKLNSYYYYHSYLWEFAAGVKNTDPKMGSINLDNLYTALDMLPLVFSLTVVHDTFSYFVFCFFNLAFDLMTVLKLKQSLAEKARLSAMNKRDEQMQAEIRSVIMVVLNSVVNILLRLPELLAIIFFFALALNPNQQYPFKILCYDFGQCLTLGQISNSFIILSLSFNVFFYYFFNKTFKFAFHFAFGGNAKSKEPRKSLSYR